MSIVGAVCCGFALGAMAFGHWTAIGYVYWTAFALVAAWEAWRARKHGD